MVLIRYIRAILVMIIPMMLAGAVRAYPGEGLFGYTCAGENIVFTLRGTAVISVARSHLIVPLAAAVITQQNQPIAFGGEAGLWALKSYELQIHLNADAEGSKLVLPVNICGDIPRLILSGSGDYILVAGNAAADTWMTAAGIGACSLVEGSGEALAIARIPEVGMVVTFAVAADGTAIACAHVDRSGGGLVAAAVMGNATAGAYAIGTAGTQVHIVQPGENLFRIALRYHTSVETLARLNGIADPARILVGQAIRLP